jgi:hypothetical protein
MRKVVQIIFRLMDATQKKITPSTAEITSIKMR